MALLSDGRERAVREVLEDLGSANAYTTILTVLQRLHDKGEVLRRKDGQAFVYRLAPVPRDVVNAQVARLLSPSRDEPEPALMAFIEGAHAVDPGLVDRLEELIRQWKRRGRRK